MSLRDPRDMKKIPEFKNEDEEMTFWATAVNVVRFSISCTARMSGVRSSSRTLSDALFNRLANAVAVNTGSLMDGSLVVSKNRSML